MNVKFHSGGGRRTRLPGACPATLAPLLLAWPALAAAAFEAHPYAASEYEYNSNVFSLASREEAVQLDGNASREDTTLRSVVGLDASYADQDEKISAIAEGRRSIYERFSDLDHNEYLLSGAFDWKLYSAWDGRLKASQELRMASFADRTSTQLALENDRNLSSAINVNVTPEWRLETLVTSHRLNSPLPGYPDFRLQEGTGSLGVKYLGVANFTSGLQFIYTDGRFSGLPDSPAYTQLTAVLTYSYRLSGLTTIDGNIGYTYFRSRDPGGDNVGGLSALLGITEHITTKTDAHLNLFRRVDSYVAGADAVVDTGAEAGLDWRATGKIDVTAGYQWIYSSYQALGPDATAGSDRRDHYQAPALTVTYAAADWLSLRAYANYYNRSSDIDVDSYNQALAGIELRLRLP